MSDFPSHGNNGDPVAAQPSVDAPLSDVRILAVEQFGAGPWATLQLADLGAEVVKVERPGSGGDVGRYIPPYQTGEDSLFFETFNRNKRSVSLDLDHADGRRVFHDLVREVDAVFCNLRGDQPLRLGLTYEQLRHVNPRIVCCSLSGFGMTGPRAAEGAYDPMIQGLAGWMEMTGEPSAPPTKTGLSLVDYCGGYVAALSLLAGITGARRDGVGRDCDLSLFETALSLLTYVGTWVATKGHVVQRHERSAHPSLVPFQAFPTTDSWIVVACAKERLWQQLCRAIERPDLLEHPDYADFTARHRNRGALLAELEAVFAMRTTAAWLEILTSAGVPSGPVNNVAEALKDPQVAARDGLQRYDHPTLGEVFQVTSPLRVGASIVEPRRAPHRGEDSTDVLRRLCRYPPHEIERLKASGAFGDATATEQSDDGAARASDAA